MSDLTRLQHPRFAELWQRVSLQSEARGTAAYRARLLAGVCGRGLEVGAGNALNDCHHPPIVTKVVAVEPEARLRAVAELAAAKGPVPKRVVTGQAADLPPHRCPKPASSPAPGSPPPRQNQAPTAPPTSQPSPDSHSTTDFRYP